MYRDDLEAAQARGDALDREATDERERADGLEREVAALRARNADLEAKAAIAALADAGNPAVHRQDSPDEFRRRLRRSTIGWMIALGGVGVLLLAGLTGVVAIGGVGIVAIIVGLWLA